MDEAADKTELVQIGRLAFRIEDDTWNAYYALPGTMDEAVPLASIKMALVASKERKDAFLLLMRDVVADIIEQRTGTRPEWGNLQVAPESEREIVPAACICGVGDVEGAMHRDWCPRH